MTFATLDYQDVRLAVLQLPQKQRLQLIKDVIATLTMDVATDEDPTAANFDFAQTLAELQSAFAKVDLLSDQAIDDARLAHLLEKHGA
ncbi:MAG: hypothetical protein KF832_31655 [Caldilineaceae bacterium]|nr:hypothetical protein [Caldilineaceae bacterium]